MCQLLYSLHQYLFVVLTATQFEYQTALRSVLAHALMLCCWSSSSPTDRVCLATGACRGRGPLHKVFSDIVLLLLCWYMLNAFSSATHFDYLVHTTCFGNMLPILVFSYLVCFEISRCFQRQRTVLRSREREQQARWSQRHGMEARLEGEGLPLPSAGGRNTRFGSKVSCHFSSRVRCRQGCNLRPLGTPTTSPCPWPHPPLWSSTHVFVHHRQTSGWDVNAIMSRGCSAISQPPKPSSLLFMLVLVQHHEELAATIPLNCSQNTVMIVFIK